MTATHIATPRVRRAPSIWRAAVRLRKLAAYIGMAMMAGCEGCDETGTGPKVEQNLKITVNPGLIDVAQGTSGQYTVSVERIGFSGPVALDLRDPLPTGTTITFDPPVIPSGSTTSTATITLDATANVVITNGSPSIQTVVVRGKAPGIDDRFGSMMYSPVLAANAGFTLSMSPPTLTLRPGQSGDALVMVNRQGNFRGPITFRTSTLSSDAVATITPVAGQSDTYLAHITVPATSKPSLYPETVTITGTSSGVSSNYVELSVSIMDASVRVKADRDVRMRAGGQDTATVKLTRGVWFGAPVSLSVDNLAAGLTATFASNPADAASLLTIRAASNVAPGTYPIRIRGTPPTGSGAIDDTYEISAIVDPPLQANAYTMQAPNMNVVSGSFTSSIFNVTRGNGFVDPITVNMSRVDAQSKPLPMPTGMSVSLDQNPITGSFTTIRLNTSSATPAGTYTFVATGVTANAADVTSTFTIVVTAPPVATSVTIYKLVNGTLRNTTSETIANGQIVQLRAVVLDQNGQPMLSEPVTWTTQPSTTALIWTPQGDIKGFGTGTATIVATVNSNTQIRKSIQVAVVAPLTTNVVRMEVEPGNAEITAPASQQYYVNLYGSAFTKMDPEPGTTITYESSNPTIATVNDSTGVVKGIAPGTVTITATYNKNGVFIKEASTPLRVYPAGTAGHYGSAYISTNSNNTRTVRAGQILLFQLFVFDVNGVQKPVGVTPAPVVTSTNSSVVTIAPSTITGGYFYNMVFAPGTAPGKTVTIRYDVMGAGGEIVMTIVP